MNSSVLVAIIAALGGVAAASVGALKGKSWKRYFRPPPDQFRYFYYISRCKVEMIGPQFGVETSSSETDLPRQTVDLTRQLEKHGHVRDLIAHRLPQSNVFYKSTNWWRHGLFYFKAKSGMEPVTAVSYIAWTLHAETIILLVGSPHNVLGEKEARAGVFIPGTSAAVEAVFHLLDSIHVDQPHYVHDCYGEGQHGDYESTLSEITIRRDPYDNDDSLARVLAFSGPVVRTEKPLSSPILPKYSLPPVYIGEASQALPLAVLCAHHFANLPRVRLETVFRVFSTYTSGGENLFHDLTSAGREYRSTVKTFDFRRYNTVCVGSPIYTALV